MIMHTRRTGGGPQGGRNVVVVATFLGPQEEHLSLQAGQAGQSGPQAIGRFPGCTYE